MVEAIPGARLDAARDAMLRAATSHEHLVQFYESEASLYDVVGGFLVAGIREGQPVLAVASARHCAALAERLAGAGIAVERAARTGELTLLDASETLERVMLGGDPQWDRFRSTVGGAIEALGGGPAGRKVRVYGELVDLLWQSGATGAAIRLEEMWGELARTHPHSLLCAYGMEGLTRGAPADDRAGAHGYALAAGHPRADGEAGPPSREVARLERRARALERELERRRGAERALREALEDKRRLDEQMRARNEELARALRLAEAFVGMLGHDLRNPLNAIATGAALVARRAPSEAIAGPATRIVRSARRMARMIDQILDFTRIRLGKGLPLVPRPLDLAEVCRAAADELEGESDAPRVRLDVRGDVAGSWDVDRLAQLVSNLVANALVHGRPGAPVSIVVDGTGAHEVVLEVGNAGAISPAVLPDIFEPFAAGGPGRAASRGLGLGLHISRQIAGAHGGSIHVSSSEEGWTRFAVRLPRAPPVEGQASPASPQG